jgi:hypothetical protein
LIDFEHHNIFLFCSEHSQLDFPEFFSFLQRTANALFSAIRQATDCEEVTIKLSFLEIYNEVVYVSMLFAHRE